MINDLITLLFPLLLIMLNYISRLLIIFNHPDVEMKTVLEQSLGKKTAAQKYLPYYGDPWGKLLNVERVRKVKRSHPLAKMLFWAHIALVKYEQGGLNVLERFPFTERAMTSL